MRIKKWIGSAAMVCLLVSSTGCDLILLASAGAKLANNQLGELSADEIRILSQAAADAINANNPGAGATALTQAQAQAIADFFDCNNVQTAQDLEMLGQNAEMNPGSVQCLEQLAMAFQGTNQQFDPNAPNQQDFDDIFGQFE